MGEGGRGGGGGMGVAPPRLLAKGFDFDFSIFLPTPGSPTIDIGTTLICASLLSKNNLVFLFFINPLFYANPISSTNAIKVFFLGVQKMAIAV